MRIDTNEKSQVFVLVRRRSRHRCTRGSEIRDRSTEDLVGLRPRRSHCFDFWKPMKSTAVDFTGTATVVRDDRSLTATLGP
ncbi:hypothetical protein SLA2020_437460 [Shorea laevis]